MDLIEIFIIGVNLLAIALFFKWLIFDYKKHESVREAMTHRFLMETKDFFRAWLDEVKKEKPHNEPPKQAAQASQTQLAPPAEEYDKDDLFAEMPILVSQPNPVTQPKPKPKLQIKMDEQNIKILQQLAEIKNTERQTVEKRREKLVEIAQRGRIEEPKIPEKRQEKIANVAQKGQVGEPKKPQKTDEPFPFIG